MKKTLLTCIVFMLVASFVFANGASEGTTDSKVYRIDLGTVYADSHVFAQAMDEMAKTLNERSGGRLDVRTFHNSTLGSEKDQVDGVASGSIQMVIVGGGQIGAMYPAISVFDAPFCIANNDHLQRFSDSEDGKALFEGLTAKTNIRIMGSLFAGSRYITSNKAIYSPDDLKGMKIRVPDQELSIANFKAFGANPTPMALSEVYLALQQNVVDGQENPLTQIISQKFYEVQKYIALTGHVGQVVFLCMNNQFYQTLPEDLQALVTEVALEYSKTASETARNYETEQLALLKNYGMTVTEPDVDAFRSIAKDVIAKYESAWGAGLYDTVQKYR